MIICHALTWYCGSKTLEDRPTASFLASNEAKKLENKKKPMMREEFSNHKERKLSKSQLNVHVEKKNKTLVYAQQIDFAVAL